MRVLTLGHSRRTLDDFVDLVRAHGVTLLVDVRRYPMSRRNPQFNRDDLAAALAAVGVGYRHAIDLGGRRAPVADSPNTHWKNEQFRGFADHTATPAFAAAVQEVLGEAGREVVALMCAEAVPWRCHRRIISDRLVAEGHEVIHVLDGSHAEPHVLSPAARLVNGQLIYPGPPSED